MEKPLGPADRIVRHKDGYWRLEWDGGRVGANGIPASITMKRNGPALHLNHVNRRALPEGSGPLMLAGALALSIAENGPPAVLVVEAIINEETLGSKRAGGLARESLMGRMVTRGVHLAGGRIVRMIWCTDEGHPSIEAVLDWRPGAAR